MALRLSGREIEFTEIYPRTDDEGRGGGGSCFVVSLYFFSLALFLSRELVTSFGETHYEVVKTQRAFNWHVYGGIGCINKTILFLLSVSLPPFFLPRNRVRGEEAYISKTVDSRRRE